MPPERGSSGEDSSYSVPTTEQISAAALAVLREHHTVTTLTRLCELVLGVLQEDQADAALRPERLRRILVADGRFDVEVQYREEPTRRALSRCPVCRGALERSKNLTIFGGTVTVGFRCTQCSYWTGRTRRVPTLYRVRAKRRR